MKPKIVHAKDYDTMSKLSELFIDSKFSIMSQDKKFILLKKKNYGHILIHLPFILIAIFFNGYALFINVIYFAYSVFKKSNIILITLESNDEDGNPLEFDDVRKIEVFYNQETWDKAIELSELN